MQGIKFISHNTCLQIFRILKLDFFKQFSSLQHSDKRPHYSCTYVGACSLPFPDK